MLSSREPEDAFAAFPAAARWYEERGLLMGGQSLFDPNREIEPEAPQSEDKRVGVFVLLVLALVVALVVALVAYYFLVLRPFMVIEKAPAQTGLTAPRLHLLAQD